ncbi:hypothetical protein GJ496_004896, partial [Pomphorhynchus laevis]
MIQWENFYRVSNITYPSKMEIVKAVVDVGDKLSVVNILNKSLKLKRSYELQVQLYDMYWSKLSENATSELTDEIFFLVQNTDFTYSRKCYQCSMNGLIRCTQILIALVATERVNASSILKDILQFYVKAEKLIGYEQFSKHCFDLIFHVTENCTPEDIVQLMKISINDQDYLHKYYYLPSIPYSNVILDQTILSKILERDTDFPLKLVSTLIETSFDHLKRYIGSPDSESDGSKLYYYLLLLCKSSQLFSQKWKHFPDIMMKKSQPIGINVVFALLDRGIDDLLNDKCTQNFSHVLLHHPDRLIRYRTWQFLHICYSIRPNIVLMLLNRIPFSSPDPFSMMYCNFDLLNVLWDLPHISCFVSEQCAPNLNMNMPVADVPVNSKALNNLLLLSHGILNKIHDNSKYLYKCQCSEYCILPVMNVCRHIMELFCPTNFDDPSSYHKILACGIEISFSAADSSLFSDLFYKLFQVVTNSKTERNHAMHMILLHNLSDLIQKLKAKPTISEHLMSNLIANITQFQLDDDETINFILSVIIKYIEQDIPYYNDFSVKIVLYEYDKLIYENVFDSSNPLAGPKMMDIKDTLSI